MAYATNATDFCEHLNALDESGGLERAYADHEERLSIANLACSVIMNQGGVIGGRSRALFLHAMTGLPIISRTSTVEKLLEPFVPFNRGLDALEEQFTGLSADIPFIPGKSEQQEESSFNVDWHNGELPYWVNVRGQLPYIPMVDGGWGLGIKDTSLEYRVNRNPVTNKVVGQVVARKTVAVNFISILGIGGPPVRSIQGQTLRRDVVLYQAERTATELPRSMPVVVPARFGLDIVKPDGLPSYEVESSLVRALLIAASIAKHRGDDGGVKMLW